MEVIRDLSVYQKGECLAISLGMFDGVHLGHQAIIKHLGKKAKEKKCSLGIFSFWPHPRKVIDPNFDLKLLTTLEEKSEILENLGVDYFFLQEFDENFRNLEAEDFVREILVKKLNTQYIIIGYDHRFGKNQRGDFELLKKMSKELDFEVEKLEAIMEANQNISSTKIRKALAEGCIKEANAMLGYAYSLSGEVVHGKKIGRTIGYPTANISIKETKSLPKKGAYIVEVWLKNQCYKGMLSIGTNLTVNGENLSVEVYILDFSGNIYGEKIKVKFRDFLHEEIKFENLEKLIERLDEDKKLTEQFEF